MIAWHGKTEIRLSESDIRMAIEMYLNRTEYSNSKYDVVVVGYKLHRKSDKGPITVEVKRANSK